MAISRSGWVTLVAVLYLISGAFNLLVGLAALGVSLSGSSTVETVYVGDWPTDHLEAAAVVVIVLAALQLLLGAGIWRRERWAWIAGLVIAALVVVTHIFYYRLLDGWAVGGVLTNLLIIWILMPKRRSSPLGGHKPSRESIGGSALGGRRFAAMPRRGGLACPPPSSPSRPRGLAAAMIDNRRSHSERRRALSSLGPARI